MVKWLISPPAVFIIILAVILILNRLFTGLAARSSDKSKPGSGQSYACGESNYDNNAQPDYSQFFPFAFFFTLAHVTTLMITTMPPAAMGVLVMAGLYIIAGGIGLYILLRK